MELLTVILFLAVVIIVGALPFVALAAAAYIPIAAIGAAFLAKKKRSSGLAAIAAVLVAVTIAGANYSFRYLNDKDNDQKIEEPIVASIRWPEPFPRTFVSRNGGHAALQRLVRAGVMDKIVSFVLQKGSDGAVNTTWQVVGVKSDSNCRAAFEADNAPILMAKKCLIYTASQKPQGPYLEEFLTQERYPKHTETRAIYLVDGTSRQLVFTCAAEWPRYPYLHSSMAWLVQPKLKAISRKYMQCREAVLDQITAGSITRTES